MNKNKKKKEMYWLICSNQLESVEAVNGTALTFERIDDVQRGHRLSARVLGVGHGVLDHILEEGLDHRARLLIDLARDALHSAATRQTTDRRLSDARNVTFAAFAETLGATLAQALATFAAARHAERGRLFLLLL